MRRSRRVVVVVGAMTLLASATWFVTATVLAASGTFADDDGSVHEGFIEAIAAAGITKGCNPPDNTLYCPHDLVTRAQMATFLVRALQLTPIETDAFTDLTTIHRPNINAIAAAGITKGCNPPDNTLYCPHDHVTRAQMATFLGRALGLTPLPPPPDDTTTTTAPQGADLSLSKATSDPTAEVGDHVRFTLVVSNAGPNTTTEVTVRDVLPSAMSFESAVADVGSYDPGSGLWIIGTLAADGSAELAITAEVVATGVIENVAEVVSSSQPDPDSTPDNGVASEDDHAAATVTATTASGLTFLDVTAAESLIDPLLGMHGHAAAWGDVDEDGSPDLLVGTFADRPDDEYRERGAAGPAPDRLLVASGSFTMDPAFPEMFGRTSGAVFADLDGDRDLDLVLSRNFRDVARGDLPTQVLENTGGDFTIVADSGMPSELGGRSVGVLDYDEDGFLDLFIAEDRYSGGSSVLLRNDGTGLRFVDRTSAAGLPPDLAGFGVGVADLNGDGHSDLFVAGSNRLFMSDGDGTFHEGDSASFAWETFGDEDDVTGVSIADLNRDGLLDLVLGHHYNSTLDFGQSVPIRVYLHRGLDGDGDPIFEDVTDESGLPALSTKAPHVEIQDFDNDGWPDLLATASASGGARPAVFRHLGLVGDVPRFSAPDGLGDGQYWVTGPTADYDGDGRLDVMLVEWEPALPSLLLRNVTDAGNWLGVEVCPGAGRGLGSQVMVYEAGSVGMPSKLLGMREVTGSHGYAAGVAPTLHFGLGGRAAADVRVVLPLGTGSIDLHNVAANRVVTSPCQPPPAGDSTMFRNDPARTGVYDSPPLTAPVTAKWSFTAGDAVDSSPAVLGGTVYVGSRDFNLYAIDAHSGTELWRFITGDKVVSSPAVAHGNVYVGSFDGNIYAVEAASGIEQWRFSTGAAIWSSPAVVDDAVYVGSNDRNLYAVDAHSGAELWSFTTGATVFSSPAVVAETVYVGSTDGNVYALDAADGGELWRFDTGGPVLGSPAVADGVVFVGSDDFSFYAIDATTGVEVWSFATGGKAESSPAVANGVVFAGSNDGFVYALDAADGTELWRFDAGGPVYSSPAYASGALYFGSEGSGNMYAVNAATGEELWRFQTGVLDTNRASSPSVVDGIVYVGSDQPVLYALE